MTHCRSILKELTLIDDDEKIERSRRKFHLNWQMKASNTSNGQSDRRNSKKRCIVRLCNLQFDHHHVFPSRQTRSVDSAVSHMKRALTRMGVIRVCVCGPLAGCQWPAASPTAAFSSSERSTPCSQKLLSYLSSRIYHWQEGTVKGAQVLEKNIKGRFFC